MNKMEGRHIIKITKSWIDQFVIAHNLCPYANVPFRNNNIHYVVASTKDLKGQVAEFWTICDDMLQGSRRNVSTSFYILPNSFSFDDLLAVHDVFVTLLEATPYSDHLQLVPFHPEFVFEGDASNECEYFVNRSPYPMIHLLRSAEMDEVTANIEDDLAIPAANKKTLEKLGAEYLQENLKSYHL